MAFTDADRRLLKRCLANEPDSWQEFIDQFLGLFVHVTAGFGDVGFSGYWTLEMFAVHPVRIYPGIPICQIFYHEICGKIQEYASKYQHNRDIQPSLMFEELASHRKHNPQLPLNFGVERSGG